MAGNNSWRNVCSVHSSAYVSVFTRYLIIELMKENEMLAIFLGWIKCECGNKELHYKWGTKNWEVTDVKSMQFSTSYDWLMPVWVKFRHLTYEEMDDKHLRWCERIRPLITDGTITEAFDELVRGIEWYNSLNIGDK